MRILKILAIIIALAFITAMSVSCEKKERDIEDVSNDLLRNVLEYERAKDQRELDSICKVQDSLIKEYDIKFKNFGKN